MNPCAALGCDVPTRDRYCSPECEANTCAVEACVNPAQQLNRATDDRHDPRAHGEQLCGSCATDTYDKGAAPPRRPLSWLGEVYRPVIAGWVAADGTRVCCDQAALVHPYPCPWHVPWGGWPKPRGSVTPDHCAPIGVVS